MSWGPQAPPPVDSRERAELLRVLRGMVASYKDCGLGDNFGKVMAYLDERVAGNLPKSPRDELVAATSGSRRGSPLSNISPAVHVVATCLTAAEPDYSPQWWLWSIPAALRLAGRPIPDELMTWSERNCVDLRAPWHRGQAT